MKVIYQIFDAQGNPQGGHTFIAPDVADMATPIPTGLPDGWTFQEVASDEDVIAAPIPETLIDLPGGSK